MKIDDDVVTKYVQNVGMSKKNENLTNTTGHRSISVTGTADSNQSTSVSLSGRAIMLSRLFGTQNSNTEPPVMSGVNGMDLKHIGMSPQNFLTTSDRALLSDMYEYAQQQGADLQNVDQLAYALGTYRQSNNGRSMSSFNGGIALIWRAIN